VREPLYSIIASRAEARIRSGEWAPGSRLPPERELCRLLDVSRATLRQALAELEDRGLLTRHQGRGTYVARPRVVAELAGFFSMGAALRARGMEVGTRVLGALAVEASRQLAADLGVLPGDPVLRLERLRSVEAEPLILETSHLPLERFAGLEGADFAARSLYDILREDHDCVVRSATETLEPVIATPHEAAVLGVPRHSPCLLIRRVTLDADGAPCEVSTGLLRGDRSRFLLQLRVPDILSADPGRRGLDAIGVEDPRATPGRAAGPSASGRGTAGGVDPAIVHVIDTLVVDRERGRRRSDRTRPPVPSQGRPRSHRRPS
jgi:GntR family transcriptional regulator